MSSFWTLFDNALITQAVHQLQPKCLVTRGEMETPEQHLPNAPLAGPWEACFTLGNQWQYKPTNEDYKSGARLIKMLIETRAKGGNLLINAGPHPSGKIPFEQERRFRELALWMFINDQSIHNIRPCDVVREKDIWFTRSKDSKTCYVFLTGIPNWKLGTRKEFSIKSLCATDQTKLSILGQSSKVIQHHPEKNPESRFTQEKDTLKISVVRNQRIYNNRSWHNPIVVKMENIEFVEQEQKK